MSLQCKSRQVPSAARYWGRVVPPLSHALVAFTRVAAAGCRAPARATHAARWHHNEHHANLRHTCRHSLNSAEGGQSAAMPATSMTGEPSGPRVDDEQAEANLERLARFLSPVEIQHVLSVAPKVLAADLGSWFDFLQQYGFTDTQISYLLCQAPQALAEADLLTAGQALATMREAGLDEGSARALVVSYPQLLHSTRQDIVSMLRTLSRFSTGLLDVSC